MAATVLNSSRAIEVSIFVVRAFVRLREMVADVRAFGLTWSDCEELLGRLGYSARVEIGAV